MTDPVAQPEVTTEAAAPKIDPEADLNARMASLLAQMPPGEPEPEEVAPANDGAPGEAPKPANEAEPAKAAEDPAEKERNDHRERLRAAERERVRETRALAAERKAVSEAKAAAVKETQEAQEFKRQVRQLLADPEALLAHLEQVDPTSHEKVSRWLLAQADPAKRAEMAARKATSAVDERVARIEAENKRLRDEMAAKERAIAEAKARDEAYAGFGVRVTEVADEVPLVARFYEKRRDKATKLADTIADEFTQKGDEWNFDDVIIEMNKRLTEDAEIYGAQTAPRSDTSTTEPNQKPAAAKANTLTNRAASTRASIADPSEDFARLPLEERMRREERRLRAIK